MGSFVLKLIAMLLTTASPAIRDALQQMVTGMKAKAKATDNPIDDILVELLAMLLGVD